MSWKDKAIVLHKRLGASVKFAAKMILGAVLPGGPAVVQLVGEVIDCVHETTKDNLAINEKRLPTATEADWRRVEEILDLLASERLAPLIKQVAKLDGLEEKAAETIQLALSADANCRDALRRLDHLARRFDRLEEQYKKLLQSQGYAADVLSQMLPLMRRMAGVADYIDDLCLAGVSAADFRSCLHDFQEAARAFPAGQIAKAAMCFQKAAQSQPRSAAAATALAAAKAAEQDFRAAEQSIARAARLRPDDPELAELHRRITVVSRGGTPLGQLDSSAAWRQPPKVGDTLDGWRLDLLLGHGGWGRVFRASRGSEARAIKLMHPELSRNPLFVERFKKEFLTLASLRGHKNLVAIDTFGYAAGAECWYFVMELIEGMSLERYLQKRGALTLPQARPLFLALAEGLAVAHASGIIHRDIKPANILLRRDGTPVLVDFGLTAVADETGLTQTGLSAGCTAMFAAPEQLRRKPPDARSDIYSLVASFYYALVYDKPEHREPDQFEEEMVPDVLRRLLTTGLHRNPERRLQTIAAFHEALRETTAYKIETHIKPERLPQTKAAPRDDLRESTPCKIKLRVSGSWYARSIFEPEAEWGEDVHTPATITVDRLNVYRFDMFGGSNDDLALLVELLGNSNLQSLGISVAEVTDAGLAHLHGLTNLQSLELDSCDQVTDKGLYELEDLPNLKSLSLGWGHVMDSDLIQVGRLTKLEELSLGGYVAPWNEDRVKDLSDRGLAKLSGLTNLKSLKLDGCKAIGDAGLTFLRGLTNLRSLDLHECDKVTDAGLSNLRELTSLNSLSLDHLGNITAAGLANLRCLANLKSLKLSSCYKVAGASLNHLSGLTSLEKLELSHSGDVSDADLANLRCLTNLKSLELTGCDQVTDSGLAHLRGLRKLQTLQLWGCNQLSDAGLLHLRGLTKLERLGLWRCENLSDAGLAQLGVLTWLKSLDLSGLDKVTDAGLIHLRSLNKLEELYLSGCKNLSDAGFAHLGGLTGLKSLYLSHLDNKVTDTCLTHLRGLTNLQSLGFDDDCPRITQTGLQALSAALPLCNISLGVSRGLGRLPDTKRWLNGIPQ